MTRRRRSILPAGVVRAAAEAGLSPIVSRIALIIADIRGSEQALRFVASCRHERSPNPGLAPAP